MLFAAAAFAAISSLAYAIIFAAMPCRSCYAIFDAYALMLIRRHADMLLSVVACLRLRYAHAT